MNLRLPEAPLLLLSFFLLAPSVLTAQRETNRIGGAQPERAAWLLGPTAIIGHHSYTGRSNPEGTPVCGPVENGGGWGFGLGLSAEWLPGADNWSLLSRLTYEQRSGGSFREISAEPLPPSDPNVPFKRVTWSEITYALLNAEVLLKKELFAVGGMRVALEGGLAAQYALEGHIRVGYETDSAAGICFDEQIPGLNPFRCSLKGGIQGEIPISGNRWIVSPGIYYDYALTNISSAENGQVNSLIFQVDFRTVIR